MLSKKRSPRKITVYFSSDQIGNELINNIAALWNHGVSISIMIKKINPKIRAVGSKFYEANVNKVVMSYVDIYAVLNYLLSNGIIRQRQNPKNELTIEQFKVLFKHWQDGFTLKEIVRILGFDDKERLLKNPSIRGTINQVNNIVKTMNVRLNDERKKAQEEENLARLISNKSEVVLENTLLKYGRRARLADGSVAVVILWSNVPEKLKLAISKYPILDNLFSPAPTEEETIRDLKKISGYGSNAKKGDLQCKDNQDEYEDDNEGDEEEENSSEESDSQDSPDLSDKVEIKTNLLEDEISNEEKQSLMKGLTKLT